MARPTRAPTLAGAPRLLAAARPLAAGGHTTTGVPVGPAMAAQPGDAKHAHFGRWTGAAPDAFAPETDEACRADETPRTWYVKCVKAEGGSKDDEDEDENQSGPGARRSGPR